MTAAGYHVKAASELSQINRILAADPVDLLILCHTLSEAECEGVFAGRELHRPRVLALTAGGRSGCQARQRIIGMADTMDGPVSCFLRSKDLYVGSVTRPR